MLFMLLFLNKFSKSFFMQSSNFKIIYMLINFVNNKLSCRFLPFFQCAKEGNIPFQMLSIWVGTVADPGYFKGVGFHVIFNIITPYIRMLDSNWLIAVIFFFTNSGLASWICRIFTSCRCICIRFNFLSWYLQNRICRFYPSPRTLYQIL